MGEETNRFRSSKENHFSKLHFISGILFSPFEIEVLFDCNVQNHFFFFLQQVH